MIDVDRVAGILEFSWVNVVGRLWMIVAMDLNASPIPEEDEETFEGHIEEYSAPEERIESGPDILRRVLLLFLSWLTHPMIIIIGWISLFNCQLTWILAIFNSSLVCQWEWGHFTRLYVDLLNLFQSEGYYMSSIVSDCSNRLNIFHREVVGGP